MSTGLDGSGRTALVTGATGGIGLALAGALAATGARVAIVGRETARIADATRSISDRADGALVDRFLADLSVQADVRRLAADVAAGMPQLDIVVHCAAVYAQRRTVTADGLETMFATNHLAPFVLTNLLQDHLTANAPARVLVLTAPSTTRLDFEDLQSERRFRPLTAFGPRRPRS
jgi:retinol dehydrogenase 14